MKKKKLLFEKHNYLNKDILMLRKSIREYDMSEAGFSLIKEYSLLPKKKINYLQNNFTKEERTKKIGKMMIYDSELAENLMECFIDIRRIFFEGNDISDNEVLSIKKDAIFVIGRTCDKLEFGDNIIFKPKNKYTSYFYLGNCEFYYSSYKNLLDVKGVSNKENPLLDDIKNIIRYNEVMDKNKIYKYLKEFRNDYLNLELELESYRELNSRNSFKLKNNFSGFNIYMDEDVKITEEQLEYLDISYNYNNFILPLINILV